MSDLPLHPALVHLPLGLAVLLPGLILGLLVAVWAELLPRRAYWIAAAAQALLLAGALAALQTGEADEEAVEEVVAESAIEEHEELAEAFTGAGVGVLILLVAGAVLPSRLSAAAMATALPVSLLSLGIGLQTGHAGGELVYRHGAAAAHVGAAPAVRGERREREEDDDD